MAFSDIATAQAMTGTTLDSNVLDILQQKADDDIIEILEANHLNVPTTNIPHALVEASEMWTCRNIKRREQADGSAPNIIRAGNYYQVTGVEKSIAEYDVKGKAAISRYLNNKTDCTMIVRA